MADKRSAAGAGKGKSGSVPKTARKTKAKTARKPAAKPNGSSNNVRDSSLELEVSSALTGGDLDPFVARAKVDVSFVHDPDALAAVNKLEGRDRVDLIGRLKEETEVRIGAFEDALRKAKGGGDGSGDDGMPGRSFAFAEIEPWPDPVNGAELLTDISRAIGRYVIMDNCQRDAAALGAVFSHTHDLRDTAPIFFIVSPPASARQDAAGEGNQAASPQAGDGEQRRPRAPGADHRKASPDAADRRIRRDGGRQSGDG